MNKLTIYLFLGIVGPSIGGVIKIIENYSKFEDSLSIPKIMKAKKPDVVTAPLDLNDNVGHALELVTNLVGIIGNSAGGLLFELTGISIHDCSQYFKDKDVSQISCDEFLDDLSNCESLGHIKPLLKSTKKRYQRIKGRSSAASLPCSKS